MRKKVLAEKSDQQGINRFQYVQQMKTAADRMVGGCYVSSGFRTSAGDFTAQQVGNCSMADMACADWDFAV